jgi:hypothetical protein
VDTDAPYYHNKDRQKALEVAEQLKKKTYIQPCLDHRHHFTPFVVSVDGRVGKEVRMVIKALTENQAHNMGKLYSHL